MGFRFQISWLPHCRLLFFLSPSLSAALRCLAYLCKYTFPCQLFSPTFCSSFSCEPGWFYLASVCHRIQIHPVILTVCVGVGTKITFSFVCVFLYSLSCHWLVDHVELGFFLFLQSSTVFKQWIVKHSQDTY